MSHPEPLLRAVPCPAEMLPKNAAALMKRAEKRGLACRATYAIGFREAGRAGSEDYQPVRSVLVKVQSPKGRLAARWSIPVVSEKSMGFDGAWFWRFGRVEKISAEQAKAQVDAL